MMDEIVNSTVDAAVYRSDGIRVYGLDAELEKKAQSKRDQQFEQQAGKWISDTINEKLEYPNDVIESLRPGVALCKLINAIHPGSIKRINTKNVALMQVENITLYLKACWKIGVPSADLFVVSDLFNRKGVNQVFQNILSVSRVAAALPTFKGPKFGAKLAAPPPVKKWETIQTNQAVYVQDLEKKKHIQQSSTELKQLKATIAAVKAEKEELWNLKINLEDKISQQEADLEVHTHKIRQFEVHTQKLEERLLEMETASRGLEDSIEEQAKQLILQEAQNQKLRTEKDKISEEVQRVFQEKLKVFQHNVLLQEAREKYEAEKQSLVRENQVILEEKLKALKEEEEAQAELTKAKISHIEELSSMQTLLYELRNQISEQREVIQTEKASQTKQLQEKDELQNQLARVSGDLVQKAVELSEMKQAFTISKDEYESRLLANKVISSKELEAKLTEQDAVVAKQKVLNKLLQANIEKMTSEKDSIVKMLENARSEKSNLENSNLELLIEKEQQREEKLELVLANQKLSLELQTVKASLKEVTEGYQKDADERLADANARISELRAQLREAEEAKRAILADQMAVSVRAQELALEHVMLQETIAEYEGKELMSRRDLDAATADNQLLRDKNAETAANVEKLTKENDELLKELIAYKHQCRNLKNKSQLEKTKHNEEIATWKGKYEEEQTKRKSLKVTVQEQQKERKRATQETSERPMLKVPSLSERSMAGKLEKLDAPDEKVRNMSFRKSVKYQAFTQNTMKKLLTSNTPPESKDMKRLTTLLTSDAGRRRFTMNLKASFKESPQTVIDNMSVDTMLELFDTMLSEMDLSNSKDFMTAKVLMQTANRMTRKMPSDKIQYMQEMIKKHEVWKSPKFWEEYFWEELAKRHRKKHGNDAEVVDTDLVYQLLGGFAYNMIQWGVSLDEGQKFAQELGHRNGLSSAQIDKLTGDLATLVKAAPTIPTSSTPSSPRGRATTTATSTAAEINTNTNINTTAQANANLNSNSNAPTTTTTSSNANTNSNTNSATWNAQQQQAKSSSRHRSRNGSVIGTRRSVQLNAMDIPEPTTLKEREHK